MDNKNIKIVDENNIDREGKLICGFSDNGNKYALYYIGRDNENDNIFVSKVVNNLDGTANLVNIDDANEKVNIESLVKKLIEYSAKNEADVLNEKTITIDGKNVDIENLLFNKEQHITVPKTYVSTVKKKYTLVASKFFNVKEAEKVFEDNDNSIFENLSASLETSSVVEPNVINPEVLHEEVKEEPKFDETVANLIAEDKEKEVQVEEPKVEESKTVEPILPVSEPATASEPVLPVEEVKEEQPIQPVVNNDVKAVEAPKLNFVSVPVEEKKEEVKTEPVPVTPVSVIPSVEPVSVTSDSEPKLFFDGSKETNLNMALGEASTDKVVATEAQDVQSLREFGTSDKTLAADALVQETPVEEVVQGPVKVRSKGFANNKFFMFIAILLFAAACVFLGYEAFQYFTMK